MFLVMWISISTLSTIIVHSSSAYTSTYSPTYDLNEICSKQNTFHLELSPMNKALFQLNASLSAAGPKGLSVPTATSSRPVVLSCFFTLRTKRPGANITLNLQWFNFYSDCHDYVQIKKPEEAFMVCLDGTSHQVLNLPNVASIDLYISVRRSTSPKHYLEIWASSSAAATGSSQTDVSSIVLAFMAPFAFILLAVIMAVMGSCCCAKKCRRQNNQSSATAADASSAAMTPSSGRASLSRPSGSRDTLVATTLADKPPAYEDLFPADFIYKEEQKHKSKKAPTASASTVATATPLLPDNSAAGEASAAPPIREREIVANPADLDTNCAVSVTDETARCYDC